MQFNSLDEHDASPVDAETKASIEEAQAEIRRGEGVSLEEARTIVREQYKAWQKIQQETRAA